MEIQRPAIPKSREDLEPIPKSALKAQQWWYFLNHPEVLPDNNQAERTLRLAVTKRKVCGESRSWDRFRRLAKLLTVIQSCCARGRLAIDFLRAGLFSGCTRAKRPSCLEIPELE